MIDVQPEKYGTLNSRFHDTFHRSEKIKVYYGGAGSAKSMSIMQHFVLGLISGDGTRRAILRKTFPSMKASTYLVLKDLLADWQIPYTENKSDKVIRVGKNELYYLALDDPEKIKGAEFSEIWLEEATEFREDDYNQLLIRLSRTSEDARIFLSFNPIDQNHWIVKRLVNEVDPNVYVHHSTYKDNLKFLSNAFIEELEGFINKDENFYRIYALGEPGVLQNKIYTHFKFEDPNNWKQAIFENGSHSLGIDFGYNAPMSVVEVWCYDEEFYIRERLYESGMTNGDLIRWMQKDGIGRQTTIYCDSAEPDRIEEISNAGFNAHPSKKDVKAGIDYVKSQVVHVDATCSPNIQKEVLNYKYKEDKNGNVLDEPVKAFDHILDATRYAMFSMQTEQPKRISAKVKAQRNRYAGFGTASKPVF
jgi:phage terminase large subunit